MLTCTYPSKFFIFKLLYCRTGSVIARYLMTFSWKEKKSIQLMLDEVVTFLKDTIPKKGIWNPLLLNGESLDIYPVEMTNFKPELDPNYIKPTEEDVSEKSSIQLVSEYVKTKKFTPSSSVLTFQESKQTFHASDDRDDVHLFSTLSDKEKLFSSQTLHQPIELLSSVHSSKVLSHSRDKLFPSLDYTTGFKPSSILSQEATLSDISPQISKIPFDSVRANIDMHMQSLLPFLPMDKQAAKTTPSATSVADMKNDISIKPVKVPSKSQHFDSTSGIHDDFFNFLNFVPSSHQIQPKSSVGRDQLNINDLDILLATGDFNKFLFPTSVEAFTSSLLEETQASVKSHGDLPVYETSLTKPLLSSTIDELSSSSINLGGFSLLSSSLVFSSERFGQTKSTSVLSSLSSSIPPISSIINDMDMSFNNLLPSIPSMKDSSIVSSGPIEQNSRAQILTSSISQSDSLNFDVTPSDLIDWSNFNIFSGFNQVTPPPSTSTGFSNDLFGNVQESVADDTQSFFDFFSHSSTKEESSNDGLPENVLMNSAQTETASSSLPTQDLGMSSGQSMFSFLNIVPKGSIKAVDEFDTATHDSIDFGNFLLSQTRSDSQPSLSTTETFEASQGFRNSLQPSLSGFNTEKSYELGQQAMQSLDSSSVLKSSAHEHFPSSTVDDIIPTTEVTENHSSDNVKFGDSMQSTVIFVPVSSIEMSSLMDGISHTENKVDEILLPSSQSEAMPANLSLKTLEPSSRNYFSSENRLQSRDNSISEWNKTSVINTDYISSYSETYTESFLPFTALPSEQTILSAHKIIDTSMKDDFSISDKKILPTKSDENEIYSTTKGDTMSLQHFNPVDESSAHNLMMQSSFLQPAPLSKSEKYAFSLNSLRDPYSDDVNSIGGSSIIPLLVQPTKTSTLPLSREASFNEMLEPITLNPQINTTDRQTTSTEQTNAKSSITNEPTLFSSLKEDSIKETLLHFNTDEFIKPTSASLYIHSSFSKKEGDSDILLSASETLQLTQSFVDSVIVTQIIPEKQTSLSFENLMTMSPFDTNVNKFTLNTYTENETMELSNRYISSSEESMTSMLNPLLNPESFDPSGHIMSLNSIDNSVPHLKHESVTESSLLQPSEKSLSSSLSFSSPDVLDFSINGLVSEVTSTSMLSSDSVTQEISVKSQISPSEENLIKDVISKEHIPTETLTFSKEMIYSIEALESLATFTPFSDGSFMNSMEIHDSQSNILQNDITSLPKQEIESLNIAIALSSLKSQTTEIKTSFQSNVMINTRSSISPSVTVLEYESVMSDGILSKNMFLRTIKSDSIQINDPTNSLMPTETLTSSVETTFTEITDSISFPKDTKLSFTKMESSDDFLSVQTISSLTQTIRSESVLANFNSSPSIRKETATLSNQIEKFDNLQVSQGRTSIQSYKQSDHTTFISDSAPMFDQTIILPLKNQDQELSTALRLSKMTEIADSKTILRDTNSEIMLHSSSSYKMESLSLNIEKQLESITSAMQPMTERFIKSYSTSTVKSQLEVVTTFYNSDISDTSSKLFPDSSFTEIIQSSPMVWPEKVSPDFTDISSSLSDMKIAHEPTKTEYTSAYSATAPLSNTADQEIMTNPLSDQHTLILDLSSVIEYSKDTKDIFDVFSSRQSTMKLSTDDIIATSVMKQIEDITSKIQQTPMHGQKIPANEFNSHTLEFSKLETVQDDRLSTDALNMLKEGTVVSHTMSPEILTMEHGSQTVSIEPFSSGVFNTPHIGILSRASSGTNLVSGLLTSSIIYSENLPLTSNLFERSKDTDTEMLVFNTFNELPIASKSQSVVEMIMQENELSSITNNLNLSLSSILHKEQLSSLRNLQPSMIQSNDVSTYGIMSEGTPYVESTKSFIDSPLIKGLKTVRVVFSSSFAKVQGSQKISSQNDALKAIETSIPVPTESLNAVFEPFTTSLPYSDIRVTDTLSSHMQTASFEIGDSSNASPYSLNSEKLNIDSSFITTQTISREPMVEGNPFSVDTVLQSLYKGSSTYEDFGMEINSESRKPIYVSSDEPAPTRQSSSLSLLPNIDTQSVDTVLQSLYKGSSTMEDFGMEINNESRKPNYLTSNVPSPIGFSSSFPNTDTQRFLKQTELQPEFLLTSASVDVLSGISAPTNSVLYMSNSLVDESSAFSSELKVFGDETLQPLSISPTSPIPDQHIPSVSNINQSTFPTSIDFSLTKTFDTDKLTSDLIVSSPFTGIIADSSIPLNPFPSIPSFEDELPPMQTLVLESSSAIPQDANIQDSNILRNYFSSEIVKNNLILNSQIIETVINTVNLNDNLIIKSSNFIPSTDLSTNKTYSVNNMDEHILNSSIVDFQLSAISSNTLKDLNTLDILSYSSIGETTFVNKTQLSLFSSESQIFAPISRTPELFQHKPNSITLIEDPFTNILLETMTTVSNYHSQAYQSELSSFQFFSDLDNTTAIDMNNNVLNNDTMIGLDTSYVTPIVVETLSIFSDMNQTGLFKGSLSETLSLSTLIDNVTDFLGDSHLFETISRTLDLSTISRVSTSFISQSQSDSFSSTSLADIKPPDPLVQTTPYDVFSDPLFMINEGIEPSLNLDSQVLNPNTTDSQINVTSYFVGSDVIFSSFGPLTNLNMHEYVSQSSTQESLQTIEFTDDKMFFDSDTHLYDISSKIPTKIIETKSVNDSYVLFERLSYGKGNDSSVFTILPTSGVPSSVAILPTTSLSFSMLFNSFFKQNVTNEMIVTSIPDQSFFHQSTIMSSLSIIDINNTNDINFPDNEMVRGTLNYESGKSIQENSLLQQSSLNAIVSHFSPKALDGSLSHTGVHGNVSRSENIFTNRNGKVPISFSSTINHKSSSDTQLIDNLPFNKASIKKNISWSKTIFPNTNNGISYSSANIVDDLLDPYMEISLSLDSLTHLSINTRTDWSSDLANSIYNGKNRNLETSAEPYSSNVENIPISSHHANLYSNDLNTLSKVVSKQSLISYNYLQNGNMPTLDTSTAAFRLDTSMPYSSIKISNQILQRNSLTALPVYLDISNIEHSSSSNLAKDLELSSTLDKNPKFFTEETFSIMKVNKTDTSLRDLDVLTITDALSKIKSESSVDTFLFTAANDYDYYATDLDFVTDYVDVTASSSIKSLIIGSSSKLPVKSRLDDHFSLLNTSQPVMVSIPILSVSNSLAKQNVLAKPISSLPIVLPVQNKSDIAKHKSTIISSQDYTDKHSSKVTEMAKETVEPSTQKFPKIDVIMPTPIMTETEKHMTSSDIDMGMDMDYYDPFAAFFGGGGPAIPQWVIDMLGTVHDSPSSSAKHYFRH